MDESWEFILENERHSVTVLVYTHRVYDEEKWEDMLKNLYNAKDEDGNNLFWRKKESMEIPIKMTQTGRPNKTTPEFQEYIEPWIREMIEGAYDSWNRFEKNRLHEENKKFIKEKNFEAQIKAKDLILDWFKCRIDELEEDKDIMSPKYLEIKRRVLSDLLETLNAEFNYLVK